MLSGYRPSGNPSTLYPQQPGHPVVAVSVGEKVNDRRPWVSQMGQHPVDASNHDPQVNENNPYSYLLKRFFIP